MLNKAGVTYKADAPALSKNSAEDDGNGSYRNGPERKEYMYQKKSDTPDQCGSNQNGNNLRQDEADFDKLIHGTAVDENCKTPTKEAHGDGTPANPCVIADGTKAESSSEIPMDFFKQSLPAESTDSIPSKSRNIGTSGQKVDEGRPKRKRETKLPARLRSPSNVDTTKRRPKRVPAKKGRGSFFFS